MSSPLPLAGDLTIQTAALLRERLLAAVDATPYELALDLGAVEACDSAGVQLLLAARHSLAQQGHHLRIVAASTPVTDALRVYGLQSLLQPTESAA